MIDENEFVDIPGYEGLYKINRLGVLIHTKDYINNIINKCTDTNGYHLYCLYKNKKSLIIRIHALMYITFIEKYDTKFYQIDHIDRNRQNNNLSNLRLVSRRNNHNNRSKHSIYGIGVVKNVNKYTSVIRINNKKVNLGSYTDNEKAHSKYLEVKEQLEEIEKVSRTYSFTKTKINGEYFLEFFSI